MELAGGSISVVLRVMSLPRVTRGPRGLALTRTFLEGLSGLQTMLSFQCYSCALEGEQFLCAVLGHKGRYMPPQAYPCPSTPKLPAVLLWVSAGDNPNYELPEGGLSSAPSSAGAGKW